MTEVSRSLLPADAEADAAEPPPTGPVYMVADGRRLWSVAALVEELGIKKTRLHELLSDLPAEAMHARTRHWRLATVWGHLLDQEKVRAGRVASGEELDPAQARARRDLAQALGTELANAQRRAELLPVEHKAQADARLLEALARTLGVLGATLGPTLAGETTAAGCQRVIDAEIQSLLRGLADTLEAEGERAPAA